MKAPHLSLVLPPCRGGGWREYPPTQWGLIRCTQKSLEIWGKVRTAQDGLRRRKTSRITLWFQGTLGSPCNKESWLMSPMQGPWKWWEGHQMLGPRLTSLGVTETLVYDLWHWRWGCSASHWKGSLKKLLSPLPMKVKVAQLCPTLCDSHTVHGILQARMLEWVVIPFSRGSSQKLNLGLLHCRQVLYQLSYKGTPLFPWWKSNSTSPADTIKTASSGTHPDHITVLPVPPRVYRSGVCSIASPTHNQGPDPAPKTNDGLINLWFTL